MRTDRREADGLVLVVSQQDTYAPEYYATVFRLGGFAVHAMLEPDTAFMLNVPWQMLFREG
jgi:hypothetical protein